jgi:DNA (cytosine-5)-methyltransferase 1
MMSALDLFSGYGGISLGLRDYVKPVAYCEIDEYARAILASRISEGELPFAPIIRDVKSIRGKLGSADIIVGGFPCQDISVAGNGVGLEGERSGLFFEIVRLTKEIAPSFVFLENVPAIRARGLRQVVGAFTEVGYDCRWTCLSAASVGAPHKRERWFLLAHANGLRLRDGSKRSAKGKAKADIVFGDDGEKEFVADTASIGSGPRAGESRRPRQQDDIMREGWWSVEPNVDRVVNGAPLRVDRIKAIGNGVVPLQVKTAFEKLAGLNFDSTS